MLPAFLWLALTCAVAQAFVLPLFYFGFRRQYYIASRHIYSVMHRPLIYLFRYSRSTVTLHGSRLSEVVANFGRDQSVIIVNHRGDLDWLVGLLCLDAFGGVGACKAMIKSDLLLVPFFGFVWWACDFISLKRNWASDESTLKRSCANQHCYREEKVPYALTVFPEGTRITPEKLQASQEFCRKKELPVYRNLLCPRTKGLWSAVSALKLDALYDATVTPPIDSGPETNMLTLARGLPCDIHIHFERILPTDIPKEEQEFALWLYHRWSVKEERLDRFLIEREMLVHGEEEKTLRIHPSKASSKVMYGAIVWYFFCAFVFTIVTLRNGWYRLFFGWTFTFSGLMALLGAVLHAVHFKKSTHGR